GDNLKANRQVAVAETAAHADCWVAGEVERRRERDDVQRTLQRLAVDLGRPVAAGVDGVKRKRRGEKEVILLEELRQLVHEPRTGALGLTVLIPGYLLRGQRAGQECVPEAVTLVGQLLIDLRVGPGGGDPSPEQAEMVEDVADLIDPVTHLLERLPAVFAPSPDVGFDVGVAEVGAPGDRRVFGQAAGNVT